MYNLKIEETGRAEEKRGRLVKATSGSGRAPDLLFKDVAYLRWHRHLPLHVASSPSFAAEARYLSHLSRIARVKRLKLAPLSEQALLLDVQMPLLTIGQARQFARGSLTTCGRSGSRRARQGASRWKASG